MALGRRIQVLRKGKGLSQERLAERLGMDRVSIGYVEQGRRSPRLSTLYAIAAALDVRVIDLFEGIESELVVKSAAESERSRGEVVSEPVAGRGLNRAPERTSERTADTASKRRRSKAHGRDTQPEQEGPSLA